MVLKIDYVPSLLKNISVNQGTIILTILFYEILNIVSCCNDVQLLK